MFAPANKAALSYIPLPARLADRCQNFSVQLVGIPKGDFPLWSSGESENHTKGSRRLFAYFLAGEKVWPIKDLTMSSVEQKAVIRNNKKETTRR